MSLDFKFHKDTPKELYEYYRDDGKCYWHPRGESLVWFTMLLKHNLTGEMTDEKLIEIARRIALIDLYHTSPMYWEGDKGYRIQMADIVAYWGLWTNSGHETKRTWDAYYNRCFVARSDDNFIKRLRTSERSVAVTRT
jgi:hypothetical protein